MEPATADRREELPPLPRVHPLLLAAAIGALWGAAGYAVLWGLSPLTVSRSFVASLPGTIALLPVRMILAGIRVAEGWAGRPFHLADTNWWIGVVAALVGAALLVVLVVLARACRRLLRASGTDRPG